MRVVLTSLAVALVATLCVALVAPLLIDWSSHRAEIAARLSALTGGEVTLGGEITARLLPTPYVEIGEGAVAGPGPDAPRLTFASARLELALVKLASGAIRFTDIRLDRPVLTLRRRADGALNLPQAPPGRAGGIGFDRLVVSDGKVVVEASQGAPRREIDGIALTGDASSLAGPYHVSGSFEGPERAPVVFRLATEPKADGRIPVRLAVDSGKSWPALGVRRRRRRLDGFGRSEADGRGRDPGRRDAVARLRPARRRFVPRRARSGAVPLRAGRARSAGGRLRGARLGIAAPPFAGHPGEAAQSRRAPAAQGRGRRRAGAGAVASPRRAFAGSRSRTAARRGGAPFREPDDPWRGDASRSLGEPEGFAREPARHPARPRPAGPDAAGGQRAVRAGRGGEIRRNRRCVQRRLRSLPAMGGRGRASLRRARLRARRRAALSQRASGGPGRSLGGRVLGPGPHDHARPFDADGRPRLHRARRRGAGAALPRPCHPVARSRLASECRARHDHARAISTSRCRLARMRCMSRT